MNDTVLAHHGVKGMKWGVRKSPSERASAKSIRYAKKAAKLQKKVVKLKKRELKNTKKELKAVYRGNIKGERTYKRRRVVASVKAAKKEAKASKFTAKSQQMLKKSMLLKASEVDPKIKEVGRDQVDAVISKLGVSNPSKKTTNLAVKREKLRNELAAINATAPTHNTGYGVKAYDLSSDVRKANRTVNALTRNDARLYKSNAKDLGLTPDKKMSKEISTGWVGVEQGIKDNNRRVKQTKK